MDCSGGIMKATIRISILALLLASNSVHEVRAYTWSADIMDALYHINQKQHRLKQFEAIVCKESPKIAPIIKPILTINESPILVLAIMKVESNFRPKAKSHKGAMGLMQLNSHFFPSDSLYNPTFNVKQGIKHINWVKGKTQNFDSLLAFYNFGYRNARIKRWPKETREYVEKVKTQYFQYLKEMEI